MKAVQCDRCKKFYLESDDSLERPSYAGVRIYSVELKSNGGNYIKGYDLCTDCAKKLYSFLKGNDEIPIQQPFINKPCISEGVCYEDKMQVLDKLRAEIEKLRPKLRPEQMTDYDYAMVDVVNDIVAIIDKYKVESEGNEEAVRCKDCYYNDGEVHAECVICDKAESEVEE